MNIKFRDFTEDDIKLLLKWFKAPEVFKWYAHNKVYTLDELKSEYLPRLKGEEDVPSYIIILDNADIGFMQYYPLSDKALPEGITPELAKKLNMDYKSSAGIDLFIGEKNLIGMGIGTKTIKEFLDKILPNKYTNIYIDPETTNTRAINAYKKCGFCDVKEFKNETNKLMLLTIK
jgi:aminoglycoside 6'-N-acetyltransferase